MRETGNVEVAIVALSLSMQSNGRWTLIPEELHQPIDQGLAIMKSTKNETAARAFADFIQRATRPGHHAKVRLHLRHNKAQESQTSTRGFIDLCPSVAFCGYYCFVSFVPFCG